MSFWDSLGEAAGGILSGGFDLYEKKELAKLGLEPAVEYPNNGTAGSIGGVPDQTAVGKTQTVGPVTSGHDSDTVTIFGITMDTGVLQVTALILGLLWFTGKLKP